MDGALEHNRNANGEGTTEELKRKYDILPPLVGGRLAREITKQQVTQLLSKMAADREWSPATFNRWQAAISLAFTQGIANEKVDKSPAAKVRRKTDSGRIRFLSHDEEAKLRTEICKLWPGYLLALDVSLHTGMRASEQFGLTWRDIDFNNKSVHLEKTKNGYRRTIRLNAVAVRAFELLKRHKKEDQELVFVNSAGAQLWHRDWFEPAVENAGLTDYTWHCNRHTFASRLVMAGVDLRTVAQLMGHRTIQMTMRYAHLAPDHEAAAVERLVHAPKLAVLKAAGSK